MHANVRHAMKTAAWIGMTSTVALGCGGHGAPGAPPAAQPPSAAGAELLPPEAFAKIADPVARSRALFLEASRVMTSPRCANCHPSGDSPTQGDEERLHDPPVARGAEDRGVPGLMCASCHQDENLELARVPGAPAWHLAPKTMAWQGRSPRAICEQVRDPAQNGGRSPAALIAHAAHDPLVAWGWSPGWGRRPAPGTQARFAALVKAWLDTGAACPEDDEAKAKEGPR